MKQAPKLAAAGNFIRSLNLALKAVRFYGPTHEQTRTQCDTAWTNLQAFLPQSAGACAVLGVSGPKLLLDGEPLPAGASEQSFAKLLSETGLVSLEFSSAVSRLEFDRFLQAFAAASEKTAAAENPFPEFSQPEKVTGIRVNQIRYVAEGAERVRRPAGVELLPARLLSDAGELRNWLDHPGNILRLIAMGKAPGEQVEQSGGAVVADPQDPSRETPAAPGEATKQTATESDIFLGLRLLTALGQLGSHPDRETASAQIQEQLTGLSAAAQFSLKKALDELASAAPAQEPFAPLLSRLAETIALRFALEVFQQGKAPFHVVRELLQRMSQETEALERLLQGEGKEAEAGAAAQEAGREMLEEKLWAALPEATKRELLASSEGRHISPRNVRQFVEEVVQRGEPGSASAILGNYASGIASAEVEHRQRAVAGLNALFDLYARSDPGTLLRVTSLLVEQLGSEADAPLCGSIGDLLLRLSEAAKTSARDVASSVSLKCTGCREQSLLIFVSPEMASVLSGEGREVSLFCSRCQRPTRWHIPKRDRRGEPRSGAERRTAHRAPLGLPIRISCEEAELSFVEVTRTIDVSKGGALFASRQPLKPGLEILVQIPYREGDVLPGRRARVIRVIEKSGCKEVAVQFVTP